MEACLIMNGIELVPERNEVHIDLSEPRTVKIVGARSEGKPLEYFLKVTQTGKLCLV